VLTGDGVGHEDDEQGQRDGKKVGSNGGGRSRGGGGELGTGGLAPVGGKDDDAVVGKHPEDVSPTGKAHREWDGEEIGDVRKGGKREREGQDEAKGAEPGGQVSASANHKSDGKERITQGVEHENFAQDGVVLEPTSRGKEEVEISGDSDNCDL